MYYLLAALNGCIIAVMVALNGGLSDQYGVFLAAVIIHVVGTLFALAVLLPRRRGQSVGQYLFGTGHLPLWMYLGGVIGVVTTVCNNFAFGRISMTSLVALGLFGQTLTSLLIDTLGLFGMPKRRFQPTQIIGIVFALWGIAVMLRGVGAAAPAAGPAAPAVVAGAVVLSFLAGVSIVLSRTVNAGLAFHIGALQGSFVNHLVGLPVTVVLWLLQGGIPVLAGMTASPRLWIYGGGMLGVTVVLLFNTIVPKMQAFHLTLLSFAGQIAAGFLIDLLCGTASDSASLLGGGIVSTGILINLLTEHLLEKRAKKTAS